MTVIKVCDVRTREIGSYCAALTVDMVGLHCVWQPPTPEKLTVFRAIREATWPQCKCVLVTRQTDIETVADMMVGIEWDYIQLHADWDPEGIFLLRTELRKRGMQPGLIGVVEASTSGVSRLKGVAEVTDLILLDSSIRGGSGTTAATANIERAVSLLGSKAFLIAGGLRAENVRWWIAQYHPWGVDVQSGVEKPGGSRQKDPELIREFVMTVRYQRDDVETERYPRERK